MDKAWSWMHKLRRAMVRQGRDRVSGIIQVDETFVGTQKAGKRGRGAFGKTLVLVMAQVEGKRIGRIRLCIIPDASGGSLRNAIHKFVEPGSIVRTDGWKGYNGIKKDGYIHEVVRDVAQANPILSASDWPRANGSLLKGNQVPGVYGKKLLEPFFS